MTIPPRLKLEFLLSTILFWRYLWRMGLFLLGLILVAYLLGQTPASRFASLLFLALMLSAVVFSIYLFRCQILLAPVTRQGTGYHFWIESPHGSPWFRAAALWWGLFWRQNVFCTTFAFVLSALVVFSRTESLFWHLFALALGDVLGCIYAFWSLVFYPFGKTHINVMAER